jgi:uncharacterized membrane protein
VAPNPKLQFVLDFPVPGLWIAFHDGPPSHLVERPYRALGSSSRARQDSISGRVTPLPTVINRVAEEPQRFDPIAGGRQLHRGEAEVEFNRIVAFSDGVFAIAITLLVLGLTVPEGVGDLTRTLFDNHDDLIAYAISFAVLGKYWLAHHRFFAALERFDGRLMGLNLLYLAFIALVPFTSQVLGDYSDQTVSVVLYAINMILVSGSFYAQVVHAYRQDLVRPEARAYERRYAGPANLLVVGVFLVSIPIAFASPLAATLIWLVIFFISNRLSDRLAPAPPGEPRRR